MLSSYPWVLFVLLMGMNVVLRHRSSLLVHLITHLILFTLTLLYMIYAFFNIQIHLWVVNQSFIQVGILLFFILLIMGIVYILSPVKKVERSERFQLQREYVFSYGLQLFIGFLALGSGLMEGFMEDFHSFIVFVMCIVFAVSLKELLWMIWILKNSELPQKEDVYKL